MTVTEHHTVSADGTTIGYRKTGSGEGLIIYHGGGRISQNYLKLAAALSGTFTVYIPDRRGRGLSGLEGHDYNIGKASVDLIALLNATGAPYIFGHSAGAMIALETMLLHPVQKLALYEPPVSVDHSLPSEWLAGFENALHKNKRKRAMAISIKGLQVNKDIDKMPFWVVMLLINGLTLAERKKNEKGTRMLDLLPTLVADMKMAIALDSQYEKYKDLQLPVFLMTGANSTSYFQQGIKILEKIIPRSIAKTFAGFDHYSPEEKTQELAAELIAFFRAPLILW